MKHFFLTTLLLLTSLLLRGEEVDTRYVPTIIEIADADAIPELEAAGIKILRQRAELLLCLVPADYSPVNVTRAGSPIRSIERGRHAVPAMDMARQWYHADYLLSGTDLPLPYTGKGVVAGICDTGFDPMHVSFRNPDGSSRIGRIVQYRESVGERLELNSEEEFRQWVTDNYNDCHATHVAGIMAGSVLDNDLVGMAPDAELVITTSELSDVGLLCGAEDIIDYAREQGKPAVINMSMGNYTGPHDGTGLFSRYLDYMGEEAIMVLSSGNAGYYAYSSDYQFTDQSSVARFRIGNGAWTQFDMYGITEVWSSNDAPLKIRPGIYDSSEPEPYWFPWVDLIENESFLYNSEGNSPEDKEFANYYNGYMNIKATRNSITDRFALAISYDAHTDIVSPSGNWARYSLVFEVMGEPGQSIDVYTDGVYTRLSSGKGCLAPNNDMSISDLATGRNLVSVGMYVNRIPEGELSDSEEKPGDVSPHSSYGLLPDGRHLPHTVAPGASVVSAYSNPYVEKHPEEDEYTVTDMDAFGRNNRWFYQTGTSMSSPYTAGTIACWLEANPHMNIDDIHNVIKKSNICEYTDPENPRHGEGNLNPYEGLKLVLTASNIDNVAEQSDIRLSFSNNIITVWNPSGHHTDLNVYDSAGRVLFSGKVREKVEEFRLDNLTPGIYIIRVNPGASLKILI